MTKKDATTKANEGSELKKLPRFIVIDGKYAVRSESILTFKKAKDMFSYLIHISLTKSSFAAIPFDKETDRDKAFDKLVKDLNI